MASEGPCKNIGDETKVANGNEPGRVLELARQHLGLFSVLDRMAEILRALETQQKLTETLDLKLELELDGIRDLLSAVEYKLSAAKSTSLAEVAAKAKVLLTVADFSQIDNESLLVQSICNDLVRLTAP